MQPTYTPNMRQRPLQKSMFLPQTDQYIPRTNEYQYQDMMKRSNIQAQSNKVNSFQFNQPQTPIHQYPSNQVLNFNHNSRYKETPRMATQFQQLPLTQQSSNNQPNLQQLNQKVIQLSQLVESHDEIIKRNNLSQHSNKPLAQLIIEQLQQKLKESYIPTIVSRQTKEIYQHIFNFKLEVNSLKEDLTILGESFKNQMNNFFNTTNVNNLNNQKTKSSTSLNSSGKIDRMEEPVAELTANVYSMENKLTEIQRSLTARNDDLKVFILSQIQKIKTQPKSPITPSKLKPSTIQSTLSPIMLQYRELFVVKNSPPQSNLSRLNVSKSPRSREQTEIVINSSTYFIDKQGYLLDSQNRYIVDVKGGQIRLEEKHLALLKQHNVLG